MEDGGEAGWQVVREGGREGEGGTGEGEEAWGREGRREGGRAGGREGGREGGGRREVDGGRLVCC